MISSDSSFHPSLLNTMLLMRTVLISLGLMPTNREELAGDTCTTDTSLPCSFETQKGAFRLVYREPTNERKCLELKVYVNSNVVFDAVYIVSQWTLESLFTWGKDETDLVSQFHREAWPELATFETASSDSSTERPYLDIPSAEWSNPTSPYMMGLFVRIMAWFAQLPNEPPP